MRAQAELVAAASERGTRLVSVRGEPPLVLRRTGTTGDGAALVHLVGGAAGPLAGDRLALTVDVGPGARLEIRSVAATIALPGGVADWSRLDLTVRVGSGAELRWLPEPLIAAAGCRHVSRAEITIADGGRLVWRDEVVCGRHGEQSGDLRTELDVEYAGRPLLVHDLAIGPDAPGWAGAAVLGGARAVGSLLTVGDQAANATGMRLAGPGVLAVAVAADPADLRGRLAPQPVGSTP